MRRELLIMSAVALSVVLGTRAVGQSRSVAASLALVGGTIYTSPTEAPIRDGVVLVDRGRIVAAGPRASVAVPVGTEVIDTAGATITAGFWNSHVHFLERMWADPNIAPASDLTRQFQMMLTQYGFTSVFDIWSSWENTRQLRARVESGEVMGPRIRATGEAMFARGSATTDTIEIAPPASWATLGFMPHDRIQLPRVGDATEAGAIAKRLLDAGVDGLKLYVVALERNGGRVPDSVIEALVKEGHARGKPVFVHPTTTDGLMASVRAGVDVLAHTTPQSGPWDDTVLAAMSKARVALIPTLSFWRYQLRHERISAADGVEEAAVDQLRSWVRAGGTVLYGTDLGWVTSYDPTGEYALMARAGMTFPQILASLTTAPAERFGVGDRLGRIAPGYTADLTVLRTDPTNDVRALALVDYTLRDGTVIYRSSR
ncbi:MAG: amidohydrolase family protein [Vicinamibacterales bacterium]